MASVPLSRVRWWRYRIPFRTPFATAHGILMRRTGLLLELTSVQGARGLGEIAPLPGFGGSLEEAWQQLPSVAEYLLAREREATPGVCDSDVANRWPAALRCGVETALLDIAAQTAGCSLAALLSSSARAAVPVNATVAAADVATAADLARVAVAAGFGTVKLKLGIGVSLQEEVGRVAAVRGGIGPAVKLRLDANEAWTPDTAIAVIRACEPSDPEWVEQPVAAGDVAGLAAVRRAVGTPIAADESVTDAAAVHALLAAEAADVLILKPTLAGGPAATLRLAALGQAAGVDSIVTSTLETGVGIAAVAQVAAALPSPIRACGLATAALLEDDLLEEPVRIDAGYLLLPNGAGLGVRLDAEKLRQYTLASGEVVANR